MSALGDEIKAMIAERRADHPRALHGIGARPPRTRILHGPRPLRRGGRLHYGAGNLPDVRRVAGPLGGRSMGLDGKPEAGATDRARTRTRHDDERRLTRGAHRSGFSQRDRRDARRDQPHSCGNPARNPADFGRAGRLGPEPRRGPGGTGDRPRQRVSRRSASAAIRAQRRALARAHRASRQSRRTRIRRRARSPSLIIWRRARKARSSKSIRPRTGWCSNSPAGSSNKAASRCSSIMATPSPGSAIRCRPCEPTAWSTRSSIPARRTSPRMSISPRWRAARARPARQFTARSIKAISCVRSA